MERRKRSRIIRGLGVNIRDPIEAWAFSSGVIKRKYIRCINTVPKKIGRCCCSGVMLKKMGDFETDNLLH